ncbi:hypothetical protein [Acinetobacter nosocomialis]|uniref:hypothetical protein n=1 Tax=Acinetobacter nosocomialis TaxID=106654 RepID=UPI001B839ED3|nr:hypothetical protein [Acinetobacter nosocomialis]MBR7716146.1 hypothetical protein [Acinetobacter nosocomialis]
MRCITTFLEDIDHEMPNFLTISVGRQAYKVDGNDGIKVFCSCRELKSVDYFDDHATKGFLYLEFSDLIAQDDQIKAKIEEIKASNLPSSLNLEIRKSYYKIVHQELVQKIKDSVNIRDNIISSHINNLPKSFSDTGLFVIVIAPIAEGKKADVARCIDRWKNAIRCSVPQGLFHSVAIVPLNEFCS